MFPVGPCQYADVVAFLLETATEKLGAFPSCIVQHLSLLLSGVIWFDCGMRGGGKGCCWWN